MGSVAPALRYDGSVTQSHPDGAEPQGATDERDGGELLRLLIDNVKDYAIFRLDPHGNIASWNLGAERIKGYTAREIIGQHFSIFYPRQDVAAGKCEFELEVAVREGRFEEEGWRIRKDGSTFWASVVITALWDETGTLRGFGKVTRDLTSRLLAEQERIQRARAEEGERRKEEFLAIMGHELRNPLAPMLTAVHLIKLRHGVQCDNEIAVLDRQLSHLTRLMDDLLDVSKILRDRVELATKPTEIGVVLARAVEASAALIEQKQQRLRLDVPATSMVVDIDADRMSQVFVNLLDNAAKFTGDGGEIVVRAVAHEYVVDVTIEDTGMGIAPDALRRIFDLFTQASQTKERQLGGFGIGLAVAKRLVEAHRGTIRAESDGLGRGSRFIVSLPRLAALVDASRSELPEARRAPVGRRVLLVDDNRDSSEMLEAFLAHLGHEVRTASDGPEALAIVSTFKPEIAFLDIGLPGMNGFDLARRLRQMPACATIPLVAVSGYARDRDREEAFKAGFTGHFAKPIDLTQLERLIEAAPREG